MWKRIFAIALLTSLLSTTALGKTQIVVLPPDYAGPKDTLTGLLGDIVLALQPADHLLVFAARPTVRQITDIHLPDGPNAENRAWVKRKLAEQAAPALQFIADLPGASASEPPGNLMIPNVLDELARNVVPTLPEKEASVLLVGSLIYFDARDGRWSMTDRYYPSEGLFGADPAKVPHSLVGRHDRLRGMTVHACTPDGKRQFVSEEHESAVKRFTALWITEQSGRIATFSDDLAICGRRFIRGDASGQPVYRLKPEAKPEMLRARLPVPSVLPIDMSVPGTWIFRNDVPISRTPPSHTKGVAWVGLKWKAACDIDLHARPDGTSPWLYFGNINTEYGHFDKDWLGATDEGQFEFVQFTHPIDLKTAEVAINLYSGELPTGPEGVARIWFDGKVYEAPFKVAARSGNGGRQPMAGPAWLRLDLRKVMGIAPP